MSTWQKAGTEMTKAWTSGGVQLTSRLSSVQGFLAPVCREKHSSTFQLATKASSARWKTDVAILTRSLISQTPLHALSCRTFE